MLFSKTFHWSPTFGTGSIFETVRHSTASEPTDNLSNSASIRNPHDEASRNDSEKYGGFVKTEANVTVGPNVTSKTKPTGDLTARITTGPKTTHQLTSTKITRRGKASKMIVTKSRAEVNRKPHSRRKGPRTRKAPMRYDPSFVGKNPEYRPRGRRKLLNTRNSRTRERILRCLRYPKSRGCHYLRRALAQPSRKRQKILKGPPIVQNQRLRMRRSPLSHSYEEEEGTADKEPAAEYESMYEDYEDYEIFAYTSMAQPTTSRPMTLFGVELYDERDSAKQDDEYLLFGNPNSGDDHSGEIDIGHPPDVHSNDPSRIMSIERQRQLADEAEYSQKVSPGMEIPEYFEYYDGYDYSYDNEQFDRTALDRTRAKPEESMEEVYFMQTSPSRAPVPIILSTSSPLARSSPKVKISGKPLTNPTKLKRVLKSRVDRITSKARRTKSTTTTTTTGLPTAIPRDSYYDTNYDDQPYDDDDYYDYAMDPLVDTDFKNFTEHAKLNRTYKNKDDSLAHSSTSPDSTIDSTLSSEAPPESTTTIHLKAHTSAREVPRRRTTAKPAPKPAPKPATKPATKPALKSQHFVPRIKRPVYASYYDDLDGLNYNWNYDIDDSMRDYYDYVYENNETSNLDIGWFSRLEDNNESLADILSGVDLLEDPESELLTKIEEGDRQTSGEMNTSNAHVLERRPYRRGRLIVDFPYSVEKPFPYLVNIP